MMALFLLLSMVSQASSQENDAPGFTEKEKLALKISLFGGALVGVGTDIAYLAAGMFEYQPDTSKALATTITSAALVTQAVTATAAIYGFTYLFVSCDVNKWWSVPVGLIAGAIGGALSGGLTFGTTFGIAVPNEAIIFNDELRNIDTWWEGFGRGFFGGGVFGGLIGAAGGAVVGPLISFLVL